MSYTYSRTIRFQDTDAAGVVYFANVLNICHEAYEESLIAAGINLKLFFSNQEVAIPIVRASVDFFRPMFCGDQIDIELTPVQLNSEKFEINYQLSCQNKGEVVAKAITKHVCINPSSRTKTDIPAAIIQWLQRYGDASATS